MRLLRSVLLLFPLLAGCAATSTPTSLRSSEPLRFAGSFPSASVPLGERSDPAGERGGAALPASGETLPAPAFALLGGGGGYTGVKAGVFFGAGDLSGNDTGASAELVFGHELLSFLAVEGSVGFLSSEDSNADFEAIPIYLQARASLPVTLLEFYGGVGFGAMYVDVDGVFFDGDAIGVLDESGFAAAGNAFLGLEAGLGNLAIGIEGKYHRAGPIGPGLEVEGTSLMVTGRLPF